MALVSLSLFCQSYLDGLHLVQYHNYRRNLSSTARGYIFEKEMKDDLEFIDITQEISNYSVRQRKRANFSFSIKGMAYLIRRRQFVGITFDKKKTTPY